MSSPACRIGLALGVASSLFAVGCSSNSFSSSNPFVNAWECTVTSTLTSPSLSKPSVRTSTTTINVVLGTSSAITVEGPPIDGGMIGDAGTGCGVNFNTTGNTATLVPGQTCPFTYEEGTSTLSGTSTLTTGEATVTTGDAGKSTLTATTDSTITGSLKSGALSVAVSGSETVTYSCVPFGG